MATINASITINSDITSNPITISKSMVLKKFQSNVGLEETTGLQAKKFTATTAVKIIDHSDGTPAKSNKVYVRNTGTNNEHFFYVSLNASAAAATTTETIGKLYAGDWMLMPWTATNNSSHDIFVAPSTTAAMTLEFMLFQE